MKQLREKRDTGENLLPGGNQVNPAEEINLIRLPHETVPVKIQAELLVMTAPYRELESAAFPKYIEKIAALLTYDEKRNLSHGILVRRFPTQKGTVIYRSKAGQLIKQQVEDIPKLGLVFGKERLPRQFILPPGKKRGRPRRNRKGASR